MKYLIITAAGIALIIGLALLPGLTSGIDAYNEHQRHIYELDEQKRELDLRLYEQQQVVTTPVSTGVWIAILLLVPVACGLALWGVADYYRQRRQPVLRIQDMIVSRDQVTDGDLLPLLSDYLRGKLLAEVQRAVHQPGQLPVQYSPSVRYDYENTQPVLPGDAVSPATLDLPGITDLADVSFLPSQGRILLALGPGGSPITAPVDKLCHVALAGATGGGKTNLLRILIPQFEAIGAQVVLADPHYADVDPATGEDWREIRKRLHMEPAVKPHDINQMLDWLTEELDRRLEHRRDGTPVGPAYFFCYDELPVIAQTVPRATERITRLLREGRKVRLLTLGASQDFLVKTIGGSSAIRDAYRTAFYLGGDKISASALLDMPQREIDDGPLGHGLALLRSAATANAQLVRVPYASNEGVLRLLGSTSRSTSATGDMKMTDDGPEVGAELGAEPGDGGPLPNVSDALNPRSARVREMILEKRSQNEIISAIWGVSGGGRAYQKAHRELLEILSTLVH